MKLKDHHKIEFPREKMAKYGEQKLADHELLAILLGSGIKGLNVLELSKKIVAKVREIGVDKVTQKDLEDVRGLGRAKASLIIASFALAKRFAKENPEILSAQDVWHLCADIRNSKREHFVAFYLDTQNRLIERQIISIGTLNASLVHPREVFEPALRLHAARINIAHNHPSGILTPSWEDKEITETLKKAGEIIGIEINDHVILSKESFISYKKGDF